MSMGLRVTTELGAPASKPEEPGGTVPGVSSYAVRGTFDSPHSSICGVTWMSDSLGLLKIEQKEKVMREDTGGVQGVAWFLAGLGVGALIGVLYAPKSGRETRDDIAQQAREGKEYLRVRGRQAAEQMGQMVDKGKDQVNQAVGRGREAMDRGQVQWKDFVERGKNIVNDQANRVSAAMNAGKEAYQANAKPTEPTA